MAPVGNRKQWGRSPLVVTAVLIVVTVAASIALAGTIHECLREWYAGERVPQELITDRAFIIRFAVAAFLIFEAACFVSYFLWMRWYSHRESQMKKQQINTINCINEIDELLFNAHEDPENVPAALKCIAQMTSAERAGFCLLDNLEPYYCYLWTSPEKENAPFGAASSQAKRDATFVNEASAFTVDELAIIRELATRCQKTQEDYLELDSADFQRLFGKDTLLGRQSLQIRTFVACPIKNAAGTVVGLLAISNVDAATIDASLMKSVALSFSMFCRNLDTYTTILKQSEQDILTGLNNRNRFEMDLRKGSPSCSLACVYLDVNGMHAINNEHGHAVGDNTLRAIAELMMDVFDRRFTYRVGGDEFVAMLPGVPEEEAKLLAECMRDRLEANGLPVSVGMHFMEQPEDVSALIKAAEGKMFSEKKAYYQRPEQAGAMPRNIMA